MDAILELTRIDFLYVFTAAFIILIGMKAIISLFEWIIEKLGLETKWMRKKREEHDLLIQTSQNLTALQEQHKHDIEKSDKRDEEISADIKKLTKMVVDGQINSYRWEIINLADKISSGKSVSKECYKHSIATYERYEQLLKDNGLENGEVEMSMELITDYI